MEFTAGNISMEENAVSSDMFACETKRKRTPICDPENSLLQLDDSVEDKLKTLLAKGHGSSKTDKTGFPSDGSSSGYITAEYTSSNEQTTNTNKQKIIQMEKKRETRELELHQIIKNAKHTASVEMEQEANKWKGIVDSKNSEIQRFRTELDSILDVLKLLQKQGVVIPVSAAVS
ncbi:Hypothetical predicted protein [Mytilus galloprovincialis]|uniref:Centrosomal protein of 162 kDa n=1 Tax=Mytilus galloprovincialis TaxID=29158 RepID=A0A8B6CWD0_MYTGA|nr:Hypothetical predicted protein [Mytilus galloprovincialis]